MIITTISLLNTPIIFRSNVSYEPNEDDSCFHTIYGVKGSQTRPSNTQNLFSACTLHHFDISKLRATVCGVESLLSVEKSHGGPWTPLWRYFVFTP